MVTLLPDNMADLIPQRSPATVLVVDDDPNVRDVLRRYLHRAGYRVVDAADGETALEQAAKHKPDLVILDVMLPGLDGLDVCARLREKASMPVIMLSALGSESDRVVGLEHGADDYVVKPFSPRELTLRVQRVISRSAPNGSISDDSRAERSPETRVDGSLTLDLTARTATLAGASLNLTVREYDLLAFFMANPHRVYSRPELLKQVWGWEFGDDSTVTVHVRRIREKIEQDPSQPTLIVTVWGLGYRYEPQGEAP